MKPFRLRPEGGHHWRSPGPQRAFTPPMPDLSRLRYRPRVSVSRLHGIPGEAIAGKAGAQVMARLLDLGIPGVGTVLSMVFSALLKRDQEQEAEERAYFFNSIIGPIVDSARSGNYAIGAGLLSGEPGREHFGYLFERARSAAPAAFATVIGHALKSNARGGAYAFARMIDTMTNDATVAVEERRQADAEERAQKPGPAGRTDTD